MDKKLDEIIKHLTAIRSILERVDKNVEKLGKTPVQKSFDELSKEAKDLTISTGYASPALFQRKLQIGYARAARLMDILEEESVIGPRDGAKPRKVLKNT
jgi:S-DNA-T family DNA segregation ATPase FtsK/SpoIIIE